VSSKDNININTLLQRLIYYWDSLKPPGTPIVTPNEMIFKQYCDNAKRANCVIQ